MPLLLLVLFFLLAQPAAAQEIHAHRGGSVLAGVPTFAEETLPAFRHAREREAAVLELDVKLTKDRVPVVIHDDTLDRTTTCSGAVSEVDLAAFKACRGDVLGSGALTAPTGQRVELLSLAEALAYANDSGAVVNLEIKNIPGENDFDTSRAYADTVMDTVLASRLPTDRLIVQSFWPPNLDAAATRMPGVQLSFLTLQQANDGAPEFARSRGYQWVSPGWPVDEAFVQRAHGLGLKVAPYTLNEAADVKEAGRIRVDAIITDDPVMARRALGRAEPPPPAGTLPAQTPSGGAAPRVTASVAPLRRSRRLAARRGWLTLRVRASQPVTLQLDGTSLIRRTVRVRAGRRTVGVRLTRTARRRMRAGRVRSVSMSGRAVLPDGTTRLVRARWSFRR